MCVHVLRDDLLSQLHHLLDIGDGKLLIDSAIEKISFPAILLQLLFSVLTMGFASLLSRFLRLITSIECLIQQDPWCCFYTYKSIDVVTEEDQATHYPVHSPFIGAPWNSLVSFRTHCSWELSLQYCSLWSRLKYYSFTCAMSDGSISLN